MFGPLISHKIWVELRAFPNPALSGDKKKREIEDTLPSGCLIPYLKTGIHKFC